MIYYHTPYDSTGCIGKYYNKAVSVCEHDDDWVVFTDRDVWFPHPHYGKIIEAYSKTTEYGLLTCITNRVGPDYQTHGGKYWKIENNAEHVKIAHKLYEENKISITDVTNNVPYISGMLMMIKKSTWKKCGGFKESGAMGPNNLFIDNDLHIAVKKCGDKVGVMNGVYVWHYYRNGITNDKDHLMKWYKFNVT